MTPEESDDFMLGILVFWAGNILCMLAMFYIERDEDSPPIRWWGWRDCGAAIAIAFPGSPIGVLIPALWPIVLFNLVGKPLGRRFWL